MNVTNNEQNIFYSTISKYYSFIFPYNPIQLEFVKNSLGDLSGKRILDIGCATGELSYQLASSGAKVVGMDLNEDLLAQAYKSKKHPNVLFRSGDMLELSKMFEHEYFDSVLCFGNTLVHLQDIEHVEEMLNGLYAVLKPGGSLFLQILNYDYILGSKIDTLPLIENDYIRFTRKYIFTDNSTIRFNTKLELKNEGQTISNETSLLALGSKELKSALEGAGFSSLKFYANFKQDAFGGKHLPLVVKCKK